MEKRHPRSHAHAGIMGLLRSLPHPVKAFLKTIVAPGYHLRIAINDLRARLGAVPGASRIIFVAGYPKSGTTWVENFVSNIPGYSPRALAGSGEVIRFHGLPEDAFDRIPRGGYSSFKTHIDPTPENIEVLVKNGIDKVLVMYRDPRDIFVSNYYHVLKSNPWKPSDSFYADYATMSKEDALSHSIELMADDYGSWVRGWRNVAHDNPDIDCLIVTFEQLRQDPVKVFKDILAFFGVELSEAKFNALMAATDNRSGRFRVFGQPGARSTKRKGTSGEWKHELSYEQKRKIKDKLGHLLIELGYEQSLEW